MALNLTDVEKKYYKDAEFLADKHGVSWEFKVTLCDNLISGMPVTQAIHDALYEWDVA
jgi:hypothetical protein